MGISHTPNFIKSHSENLDHSYESFSESDQRKILESSSVSPVKKRF